MCAEDPGDAGRSRGQRERICREDTALNRANELCVREVVVEDAEAGAVVVRESGASSCCAVGCRLVNVPGAGAKGYIIALQTAE